METDPYQANISAVEMAKRDKDKLAKIKPPKMDYPIKVDRKTVIFPKTKQRYEMLRKQYPDGKFIKTI